MRWPPWRCFAPTIRNLAASFSWIGTTSSASSTEKKVNPPGNLANAAAFIFEPDIFTYLEAAGKAVIDLSAEIIPELTGRIQGFEIEGYHRDIGTPEGLAMARQHYRNA